MKYAKISVDCEMPVMLTLNYELAVYVVNVWLSETGLRYILLNTNQGLR
jgi:CO dehydrogenase/acetyl-CoA synthase gamma subunit (corrinoid Fe-S protein)